MVDTPLLFAFLAERESARTGSMYPREPDYTIPVNWNGLRKRIARTSITRSDYPFLSRPVNIVVAWLPGGTLSTPDAPLWHARWKLAKRVATKLQTPNVSFLKLYEISKFLPFLAKRKSNRSTKRKHTASREKKIKSKQDILKKSRATLSGSLREKNRKTRIERRN